VAVSLALLVAGSASASAAVKPKPWQWTPAQAGAQVVAWNPAAFVVRSRYAKIVSARCVGTGTAASGRFAAFRCAIQRTDSKYGKETVPGVLWMKVRRKGQGQPCVSPTSFAAIPAACLDPYGTRLPATVADAWTAARRELQRVLGLPFIYQGPKAGCFGYGAGYYTCEFGTNTLGDPVNGTATITFLQAGPVVKITKMVSP
jgi:hypothetical protein